MKTESDENPDHHSPSARTFLGAWNSSVPTTFSTSFGSNPNSAASSSEASNTSPDMKPGQNSSSVCPTNIVPFSLSPSCSVFSQITVQRNRGAGDTLVGCLNLQMSLKHGYN